MDDQLLDDVEAAFLKWMKLDGADTESRHSLDSRDALVKALLALMPDGTEPSRKKSRVSDEALESCGDEEHASTPKAPTMKDVAFLILDKCADEHLETLHIFVHGPGGTLQGLECKSDTREDFKKKISQHGNIELISFDSRCFRPSEDLDKEYRDLKRQFSPIDNVKHALEAIFKSHQPDEAGMEWNKDLVVPQGHQEEKLLGFRFSVDLSKCHAEVIAGESGCGKSWFAKKWLPSKHPGASFIYHELTDKDVRFVSSEPANKELGNACEMGMQCLIDRGYQDTAVFEAVSELSRRNNGERNKAAICLFEKLVQKAIEKEEVVVDWWKNPKHTLEKLVIIMDEMGKAPDFGRAIVDEVRQICIDIHNRKLAHNVMIVLVGSGLDHFIRRDTVGFKEYEGAGKTCSRTFYGTDPMKSNVTVLMGPNLDGERNKNGIFAIPIEDIMRGTYSQVLATNTRMLTRGVLPVLKSKLNTIGVDSLHLRRVELGSTNIVMDYAVRKYIELNVLSRLHRHAPSKFEALLLNQFRLLADRSRAICRGTDVLNPAFAVSFQISREEYEGVVRAGLITADIVGTSKALRYLACKGQTAPLYAQDGICFEIMLQHHLVRLCRAEYNGEDPNYYCDGYDLLQAWPPSSTTIQDLDEVGNVEKEVASRCNNEEKKKSPSEDGKQIAILLEDKDEYDLVLRQTGNSDQGDADVAVLSRRKGQGQVNLDLYKAMNYEKVLSRSSKETIEAFASLGVLYDSNDNMFDTKPNAGSAGSSYSRTLKFANELSEVLGVEVEIRKRIVVFSQAWDRFLESKSWKGFNFSAAEDDNVWIWSKEMLEPTISALVTKPPLELSTEGATDSKNLEV